MPASEDMIEKALAWLKEGRKAALVTVTATWGSSPRPVGSQMVVDENGAFEGSVSGGCIEAAVVTEAMDVIREETPQRVTFGVSDRQARGVGLACGGNIEILVESAEKHVPQFTQILAARHAFTPVCLITHLESGNKWVAAPGASVDHRVHVPLPDTDLREVLDTERSRVVATSEGDVFVHAFCPARQVVIIGAVHIAGPLSAMARLVGFDVVIVDPRTAFATRERFPDITLISQWPDEAFKTLRLHLKSAVVALAHFPKLDDPALMAALNSDAFYIGALGSRKSHAARKARLAEAGFSDRRLSRIHGPIGLPIGAKTPSEIAVSIIAEIVAARYGTGR